MARPRVLDDEKRRQACALVAAGTPLTRAARCLGVSVRTLERERRGNEEFGEQLQHAELTATVTPLQAMRRAATTHWRAAAWLMDRQDRNDARRREVAADRQPPGRERVETLRQVREVVRREVDCLITLSRLEARLDELQVMGSVSAASGGLPAVGAASFLAGDPAAGGFSAPGGSASGAPAANDSAASVSAGRYAADPFGDDPAEADQADGEGFVALAPHTATKPAGAASGGGSQPVAGQGDASRPG